MDILSALKNEASKLQHQLETLNSAMKILGGKNTVSRGNVVGESVMSRRLQERKWQRVKKRGGRR